MIDCINIFEATLTQVSNKCLRNYTNIITVQQNIFSTTTQKLNISTAPGPVTVSTYQQVHIYPSYTVTSATTRGNRQEYETEVSQHRGKDANSLELIQLADIAAETISHAGSSMECNARAD